MNNFLRRKLRKGISFVAACAIMATNVSPWLVASYASEVPEEAYYEGADEDYEEASEEYFETPEVTMTPEAESADAYFEGSAEPTEAPSEAPDAADEAEYGLEETSGQEEAEVPDYEIDEMEDPDGDGIAEGVEVPDDVADEDAFDEDAFENDASEDDAETSDGQILENAPSVIFEESTDEVRVTVVAGLGVFPEGTTMEVKPAEDEETISKVSESVEDERTKVTGVKAVDVTFYNAEHEEIEPNGPVFVTLEDLTRAKDEAAESAETAKAVHVDDNGECTVMEEAKDEEGNLVELPMMWEEEQAAENDKTVNQLAEDADVAFVAESFSTYALVYTVDLEYTDPVTGETFAWKWPGRGSYAIADIMKEIGVTGEISDVSLVRTEDVGGSEKVLYLEEKDGAWYLTSEEAFHDTFELTVVVEGKRYVLVVTDAVTRDTTYQDLKTASGGTFDAQVHVDESSSSSSGVNYNVETQTYNLQLDISYTIPTNDILTKPNYQLTLLDEVRIPDSAIGQVFNAYDSVTGDISFKYHIEKVDGHNVLKIEYQDEYLNMIESANRQIGKNTITIDAEIGKEVRHDQNGIHLQITQDKEITIPESQISYPEGSNAESDIKVEKTSGYYDKYNNRLYFTVYVTSRHGTKEGQKISVQDILSVDAGKENIGPKSLQVESITTGTGSKDYINNETTVVNTDYTVNSSGSQFTVSNLARLGENGIYKITYYYELKDGIAGQDNFESSGSNSVEANDNNVHHHDEKHWTISKAGYAVNKSGVYDEATGKITWTITVTNNTTNSTVVTDEMLSTLGSVTFGSWINKTSTATGANGNTITVTSVKETSTLPTLSGNNLTLPADNTYTITYTTDPVISDPTTKTNISNTVNVGDKSSTGTVEVPAEAKISKTVLAASAPVVGSTLREMTWRVTIDVPKSGFKAGTKFKETFTFLAQDSGTETNMPGLAYFNATQQATYESMLKSYFGDNVTINYTAPVDTHTGLGWSADNKAQVIELVLNQDWNGKAKDGVDYAGKTITLDFKTTVDTKYITGEKNWLTNYFYLNGSSVNAPYTFKERVTKKDGEGTAGDSSKTVTRDNKDISWFVETRFGWDAQSLTLVDTLPEHISKIKEIRIGDQQNVGNMLKLVPSQDYKTWTLNTTSNWNAGNSWCDYSYAPVSGTVYKVLDPAKSQGAVSGRTLTVNLEVPEGQPAPSFFGQNKDFYFYILAEVDDMFPAAGTNDVDFTNHAEIKVNDYPYGDDDQTQTITYKTNLVNKVVEAQSDSNWNGTVHELRYSVDINPQGLTLLQDDAGNPLSGPITLQDSITYKKTATYKDNNNQDVPVEVIFSLKNGSTKLLWENPTDSGHWEELDPKADGAWSYRLDEGEVDSQGKKTKTIYVTDIPDGKHLKLVYTYRVEVVDLPSGKQASLGDIKNTVNFHARYDDEDSSSTQRTWDRFNTSGTTESTGSLEIVKVQKDKYSITLENAYFVLEKYDNGRWVSIDLPEGVSGPVVTDPELGLRVYKTGSDGTIIVTDTKSDSKFEKDVLYRLREYKSPRGYVLNPNPDANPACYFYFSADKNFVPEGINYNETSKHADNLLFETDSVHLENEPGYIENIELNKTWLVTDPDDPSQTSTEWPEGVSITVALFKRTTNGSTVTDTPVDTAPAWYSSADNTEHLTWTNSRTLTSQAEADACVWKHLDPLDEGEEYVVKETEIIRDNGDSTTTNLVATGVFTAQEVVVNSAIANMKNVSDNTQITVSKVWDDDNADHTNDTVTLKLRRYELANAGEMGMLVINHTASGMYSYLPSGFEATYTYTAVDGTDMSSGSGVSAGTYPVKAGTYTVTAKVTNDAKGHANWEHVLAQNPITVTVPADGTAKATFNSVYTDPTQGTIVINHNVTGHALPTGASITYTATPVGGGTPITLNEGSNTVPVDNYTITATVTGADVEGFTHTTTVDPSSISVAASSDRNVSVTTTYNSIKRGKIILINGYKIINDKTIEESIQTETINYSVGENLKVTYQTDNQWHDCTMFVDYVSGYENDYTKIRTDSTNQTGYTYIRSGDTSTIEFKVQNEKDLIIGVNASKENIISNPKFTVERIGGTVQSSKQRTVSKFSAPRLLGNATPTAVTAAVDPIYTMDTTFGTNGEMEITLSNGHWSETVENLPVHDQYGRTYFYAIVEENVPSGYEVSYSNESDHVITPIPATNRDKTLTATNTRTAPQTGNISVTKTDVKNATGNSIDADNTFAFTIKEQGSDTVLDTLQVKKGETKTSMGLPLNKTYVIEELTTGRDITGYTFNRVDLSATEVPLTSEATVAVTATNYYDRQTIDIPVTKAWLNNSGAASGWPTGIESVTVALYRGETPVDGMTLQLTSDNNGTAKFTGLPKYDYDANGVATEITNYTVKETAITGYTSAVAGNATTGFTVTNTPKKTSVTVNKAWADSSSNVAHNDDWVKVKLYRNGADAGKEEVQLNNNNSWTKTWDNLPVVDDATGTAYTYAVVETDYHVANGLTYTSDAGTPKAVTADGQNWTVTINNTPGETVDVEATKTWTGDKWPKNVVVTFQLKQNDNDYREAVDVTAETAGHKATWTGLPKKDRSGVDYTYTVVETVKIGSKTLIPGTDYTAGTMTKVTGEAYKWTVNNDMTTVDIPVLKTWANNPYATAVRFELQTSAGVKVTEDAYGDTIANPVVLNTGNNWVSSFEKLPKLDADGNAIAYQVVETGVCFGETTVDANWKDPGEYFTVGEPANYLTTGYSINNTPLTTTVKVDKKWFQETDTGKAYPLNIQNAQITVKLTDGTNDVKMDASGTAIAPVTLNGTEETPWTYEWTNLPKYNASGVEIHYVVVETSAKVEKTAQADGFELLTDAVNATADTDPAKPNEFHLVNTLPTITISGTKIWNIVSDTIPSDPTLILKRVSAKQGSAVETVTVPDGQPVWSGEGRTRTYTYSVLPKYDDEGYLYTYSVEESQFTAQSMTYKTVKGEDGSYAVTPDTTDAPPALYSTTQDGNDIVNTELTTAQVTKQWTGATSATDNKIGSITYQISRTVDGHPDTSYTSENVTVTYAEAVSNDKGWGNTWSNLPAYGKGTYDDNGTSREIVGPFAYTVTETKFVYDGVTYNVADGAVTADTHAEGYDANKVHKFLRTSSTSGNITTITNILNETYLDVIKKWSLNGNPATDDTEDTISEISFYLWRKSSSVPAGELVDKETRAGKTYKFDAEHTDGAKPFTITRQNGKWELHIDNLEWKDSNGEAYTYWIQEVYVPGYTNTPTIKLQDGTAVNASQTAPDKSKIVITNSKYTVALPSTGGPGTNLLYLLGSMLVMLAGAGFILLQRKKRVE